MCIAIPQRFVQLEPGENMKEGFIPIRGQLAVETSIALERLSKAKPGETVTYTELNELCGCDVRKRRNIITTPINKLLSEQSKVFVTEHSKGIRLLKNEEIPSLGFKDISRIGKIAKRSVRRLAASDYDSLSETAKIAHNTHLTILSMMNRGATKKSLSLVTEAVEKRTHPLPLGDTLKLFSA
ncbi:unnamed protein product [Sphagnum balticum]